MVFKLTFIGVSFVFSIMVLGLLFYNLKDRESRQSEKREIRTYLKRVKAAVPDPAFNLSMNTGKHFVILLASMRGGSSFLGKLFDENPRVQYLFEPVHDDQVKNFYNKRKLVHSQERHTSKELSMLYLQQIFHDCNLFNTAYYHEQWKFCGDVQENMERFGSADCPKGSPISDICKYRHTSVLKVIRLRRLSDLMLIRNIRSLDFQIVHFTRHPMGLMDSRAVWNLFAWDRKANFNERKYRSDSSEVTTKIAWEAHSYCSEAVEIVRFIERESWLKDRYLRVTHQELSQDPVDTAKIIYDFVGLEFTPELHGFILNTTQGTVRNESTHWALKTSRISQNVISKWKRMEKVLRCQINAIEAVCSNFFELTRTNYSFDSVDVKNLLSVYHSP